MTRPGAVDATLLGFTSSKPVCDPRSHRPGLYGLFLVAVTTLLTPRIGASSAGPPLLSKAADLKVACNGRLESPLGARVDSVLAALGAWKRPGTKGGETYNFEVLS